MDKHSRERCVTGIVGLDEIIGGGIPVSSMVVVAGEGGSGKSTMSFEFLVRGALMGERGLVITTLDPVDKYLINLPEFDFFDEAMWDRDLFVKDIRELEASTGADLRHMDFVAIDKLMSELSSLIDEHGIKRIVFDSLSALLYGTQDEVLAKEMLLGFSRVLYEKGCTGIAISDVSKFSKLEEIIADGLIKVGRFERKGDMIRTMQVCKMKGASHNLSANVIDLTSCGVLITRLLKGASE